MGSGVPPFLNMAKYSMPAESEDGMEGLYTQEAPEENKGSIDEQEADEMETSAVVPLKLLQGGGSEPVKEGDEIVVKVKAVEGDQATIIYAPKKPEDKGEAEMSPDKELETMNESPNY